MANIYYNNQCYLSSSDETLLETLLNNNVDFPHSCKTGTCQSCLTQLLDGNVPQEAQRDLKSTLVAKNYFLACQCRPQTDITIKLPDQDEAAFTSKIIALTALNHNVLQVRLAIDDPHDFKAGQYINLITPSNIVRSYSIANVPKKYIELHIKLTPSGQMSDWLSKPENLNSTVFVRGPMGNCFYHNPDNQSFPIVLAGTGTGLAPLLGIVSDALKSNHNGDIHLIHGGVNKADLYLHDSLTVLQEVHANINYIPCVLNGDNAIRKASIDTVLLEHLEDIKKEVRLFICGPEETTKLLKTKAFLAGVASASIYSDSFITAKP